MALTRKRDIDRLKRSTVNTDVRTFGQRMYDTLEEKGVVTFVYIVMGVTSLIFPGIILIVAAMALSLYLLVANNKQIINLPYKVPILEKGNIKDYQSGKPKDPSAEFPIGQDYTTGKALFCTLSDICTHLLCIGTTGAGKTVTLFSRVWATLAFGGGFIYQDAKAQADIFQKAIYLCLDFCRIHDLSVCNYGQKLGDGSIEKMGDGTVESIAIMSNTLNPVFTGTEADLAEYFIMQLPPAGDNNQVFLDRGIMLAKAIAPALIDLRNQRVLTITPAVVRHYMRLEALADDRKGLIGQKSRFRKLLSEKTIGIIENYLKDLNYDSTKAFNQQDEEVGKQHGYGTSYFNNILYTMSVEFEHICESRVPDAHFSDIIRYKRCYVGLIPAIGLSAEAKKSIGKMGMSGIRSSLKECIAQMPEGDAAEVIDALPVNPRIPLSLVLDEFSEQAVKDCAPIFTQARSLGIAACIGNQDLGGIERGIGKEETFMIFGSTRQKFLMSCEDPEYTIPKFQALLSQEIVAKQGQFVEDKEAGGDTGRRQSRGANIEKEDVITVTEIQSQGPGESTFFLKGEFFKGKTFYHNIDDDDFNKVRTLRIQRGISGIPFNESNVRKYANRARLRYSAILNEKNLSADLDVLSSIKEFIPSRGNEFPWLDHVRQENKIKDEMINGNPVSGPHVEFAEVAKKETSALKKKAEQSSTVPPQEKSGPSKNDNERGDKKPQLGSSEGVKQGISQPGKTKAVSEVRSRAMVQDAPVKSAAHAEKSSKPNPTPSKTPAAATSTKKGMSAAEQPGTRENAVVGRETAKNSVSKHNATKSEDLELAALEEELFKDMNEITSPEQKTVDLDESKVAMSKDGAEVEDRGKKSRVVKPIDENALTERKRQRHLKAYKRSALAVHSDMPNAINALSFLKQDAQQAIFSTAHEIISVVDKAFSAEAMSQKGHDEAVERFMDSLMQIRYPSDAITEKYRQNILTLSEHSSAIKATLSSKNRRVKSV